MLTALDKVLKSDWTVPANTSGALLHAAILATEIDGQWCWVWYVLRCVESCISGVRMLAFNCVHEQWPISFSSLMFSNSFAAPTRADECGAGASGPIQFESDGDRRTSTSHELSVYNHQGTHRLHACIMQPFMKFMFMHNKLMSWSLLSGRVRNNYLISDFTA